VQKLSTNGNTKRNIVHIGIDIQYFTAKLKGKSSYTRQIKAQIVQLQK